MIYTTNGNNRQKMISEDQKIKIDSQKKRGFIKMRGGGGELPVQNLSGVDVCRGSACVVIRGCVRNKVGSETLTQDG